MTSPIPSPLESGLKALDNADFGGAESIARHLVETEPRSDAALRLLGRALLGQGRVEEAGAALESAVAMSESSLESLSDLSLYHRASGDFDTANALLERVLAASPDDTEAALRLGVIDVMRGNHFRAEQLFAKALQSPQPAKAHLNYGILLLKQSRNAEALGQLERALSHQPDLAPALRAAAQAADRLNRPEQALDYLEKLHRQLPEDLEAARALARQTLRLGKTERALELFRAIRSKHPQDLVALEGEADALVRLNRPQDAIDLLQDTVQPAMLAKKGVILFMLDRLAEAEAALQEALSAMPDQAASWANLAAVQLERGRIGDAIEAARRAGVLDPQLHEAQVNLIQGLRLAGSHEARDVAASFLRIHRDHVSGLAAAAQLATELKDFGEAEMLLKRAEALQVGAAPVLYARAMLACERGQASEMRDVLARARPVLSKVEADLLDARLAILEGDSAAALAASRSAVEARRNVQTLATLGLAQSTGGEDHAALISLDEALEMAPGNRPARATRALVRLRQGRPGGFRDQQVSHDWRLPPPTRLLEKPLWQGQPITDKILVVHVENSATDAIFHSRFVPLLSGLAGKVILDVPPAMIGLFAHLSEHARLIRQSDRLPECDFYVPLTGVASRLATFFEPRAERFPYLTVSGAANSGLAAALAEVKGLKAIVIPMSDDPGEQGGIDELIAGISHSVPGVSFLGVLKHGEARALANRSGVHDLSAHISNVIDMIHALLAVDLVITTRSVAGHLAGAVGRPLWISGYGADWHWAQLGRRCAYYPTATRIGIAPGENLTTAAHRLRALLQGLASL